MNNLESNTALPNLSSDNPKSSRGPTVGLVIILILIIAGSFYFFKDEQPASKVTEPEPSVRDIEDDLIKLEEQSESDELEAVEKDLEGTDLSNLDQEMGQIEKGIFQLETEF
jgi:hypothetical protein